MKARCRRTRTCRRRPVVRVRRKLHVFLRPRRPPITLPVDCDLRHNRQGRGALPRRCIDSCCRRARQTTRSSRRQGVGKPGKHIAPPHPCARRQQPTPDRDLRPAWGVAPLRPWRGQRALGTSTRRRHLSVVETKGLRWRPLEWALGRPLAPLRLRARPEQRTPDRDRRHRRDWELPLLCPRRGHRATRVSARRCCRSGVRLKKL